MDLFGGRSLSAVIGVLYSGAAFGNLLGPVAAGAVFDRTGSYDVALMVSMGAFVFAAIAAWLLPESREGHSPAPAMASAGT